MKKILPMFLSLALMVTFASTAFATSEADTDSASATSESTESTSETSSAEDIPSPDITKLYFNAYLPGVPEETINDVKDAITLYSEDGGSEGGSGTLWRCIREAGTLMGQTAKFSDDFSSFTVTTEGKPFAELSADVQQQVVDKVTEGFTAIAITTTYLDGTFTFTKQGVEQFAFTVEGVAISSSAVASSSASSAVAATDDSSLSGTTIILIVIAVFAVAGVVVFAVTKSKKK